MSQLRRINNKLDEAQKQYPVHTWITYQNSPLQGACIKEKFQEVSWIVDTGV